MTDDRQRRIEAIFDRARLLSPAERDAFIESECAGDAGLRAAVTSLLAHHERAERAFVPLEQSTTPPTPPQSIGPFQIIGTLGQGGMGTVYLARQDEPINRQVALKVIRPGLDSTQVLSRFRAEQQALAQLDHPSIARVFDTGATEDGRPYFVMEYVDGRPITEYCDAKRMGFADRIAIFIQVCHAIQHAHQKGIIHRDIKPGNVIVTEHDGVAVPKVIDFGIAKATDTGSLPVTTLTNEGQLVGTLEYMSPEQAAALDIDTRTDVYALGLLLYELLVGVPPFDARMLRERGLEAMLRMIRDSEPPRPSARVSTLGDSAMDHARRCGTQPRSLARLLRGDLDWIVMKALERDRERRYASAAGFAADLGRYLHSQPVEARPPSALYRMRKFTRRHRVGVSIASLVGGALIAVAVVNALQSARVARERDRAEFESRVSNEVATYLGDMFHGVGSKYGFPDSLPMIEAMALGVQRIAEADITPEARIRVLRVLGDAYANMSHLQEAESVIAQAVDLSVVYLGEDHLETAQSRFLLLSLHRQLFQWDPALRLGQLVLPVFERELGPDHAQTLRCVWHLAHVYEGLGRPGDALVHYDRLEEAYRRTLGDDHARLGMLYNEMTFAHGSLGHYDEAERAARRSVTILEAKYGPDSPMIVLPLDALVYALSQAERYDEALAVLDRSERIVLATYGPGHPREKNIRADRGWIFLHHEQYDSARTAFEDAMILPANASRLHTAGPLVGLGIAHRKLGDIEASRAAIEKGLALMMEAYGESHAKVAETLRELGLTEVAAGNLARADSLLRASVTVARDGLPRGHATIAMCELALGECLVAEGRLGEAEPLLLDAHASLTDVLPETSHRIRLARTSLVDLYETWEKPEEAARFR